jgi:methionine transaminase
LKQARIRSKLSQKKRFKNKRPRTNDQEQTLIAMLSPLSPLSPRSQLSQPPQAAPHLARQAFTPSIASKLPDVGTTIFTVMTQLAIEHNAINLAQGFPNFPCAPELVEHAAHAMRDAAQHNMNQYAPMAGLMLLRERIAQMAHECYGAAYNPATEITVTPGATAALFAAIHAVVGAGDEVIVFEPCYDSYLPAVRLAGGVPVVSRLQFPSYSVDWDDLAGRITPRTRLIIFNTPHNPSGSVWSASDVLRLQELVRSTGIFVISDEVYEHIIFDGVQHQSAARFEELRARTFVIASFGKTFHVTGWKTGYCLAPEPLTREFRKVHQFNTFCSNTAAQYAFAQMLATPENYTSLGKFYERKRDYFRTLLADTGFDALDCAGSYFQLARYDRLSAAPAAAFARELTQQHGVAVIPVSAFHSDGSDDHVVRFCFAKTDETLEQAAALLRKIETITA